MKSIKEKEVMKIFNEYKNQIINQIGNKITTNDQLNVLAHKLIGVRFKGVFSVDTIPLHKNGMYIINNQSAGMPGEHWVAVLVTVKKVYIFDSFGRKSKALLPILIKSAKLINKKVVDTDYDVDQTISSAVCGQLSISWLLVAKQLGISNALKV